MRLQQLQEKLGYVFSDPGILFQALTHKSYGHEYLQDKPIAFRDNERLEFLGDAVLDVVVSDILLETFPQFAEGQLSKLRAAVVNEKTLAQIAASLALNECMRLGKGEAQTGGFHKPSILSSGFEALVAAIYLDGGFHAIYPVVRHLFAPLFEDDQALISIYDHKTSLQELSQARYRMTPTYALLSTQGPDHAKVFEVEVRIGARQVAMGMGSSKKEAEQNAAREALNRERGTASSVAISPGGSV